MRNPRTITALGVVLGVVLALLTAFGIGAPSASAYGPSTCAVISVSSTDPTVGTSLTVSGTGFAANTQLTIVLQANPDTGAHTTIKVITTSSTGTFSFSFVVPADTGAHIITAVGNTGGATICPPDPSASINIRAASGTSSSGGLASTGVDIAGGVIAALALLIGGTALTMSGRRKRTAHRHTSG